MSGGRLSADNGEPNSDSIVAWMTFDHLSGERRPRHRTRQLLLTNKTKNKQIGTYREP